MASRENTEADLLDLHLRKSVYENMTTYSQECGGLTKDIAQLTNEEIKEYHKKYYHLDNITAIICGQVIPDDILSEFLKHKYLYESQYKNYENSKLTPRPCIHLPTSRNGAKKTSKTVHFPSDDENFGSMGYAFRGPPSEDTYNIFALEVLFRFFNDNPSSLLSQAFVERQDPYASDIDLEIKSHIDSPIFFVFSGIPRSSSCDANEPGDDETDDEDEEDEDDEDDEDEGDDDHISSEEGNEANIVESEVKEDLFQENVFYEKLQKCLTDFVQNGPDSHSDIQAAIDRHRKKMQEVFKLICVIFI